MAIAKKIKIISLSIIIMLLANLNLLAQEERKAPKSTIVGSFFANPPSRNYSDSSIGAYLSYRYNVSDTNNFIDGINLNAGYIHYKDNEISKNDYIVTFGGHKHFITFGRYSTILYSGATFELGIIYKDIEKNKIRPFICFGSNTGFILYKNIGIEIIFKVQLNTYDDFYCGVGAGISYSF